LLARETGLGEKRLTRNPAADGSPFWSPDGREIGYTSDGISVLNADGNGQRRLARSGGWSLTWSPA